MNQVRIFASCCRRIRSASGRYKHIVHISVTSSQSLLCRRHSWSSRLELQIVFDRFWPCFFRHRIVFLHREAILARLSCHRNLSGFVWGFYVSVKFRNLWKKNFFAFLLQTLFFDRLVDVLRWGNFLLCNIISDVPRLFETYWMRFDKSGLYETTSAFFLLISIIDAFLDLGDLLFRVPGILCHIFDFILDTTVLLAYVGHRRQIVLAIYIILKLFLCLGLICRILIVTLALKIDVARNWLDEGKFWRIWPTGFEWKTFWWRIGIKIRVILSLRIRYW